MLFQCVYGNHRPCVSLTQVGKESLCQHGALGLTLIFVQCPQYHVHLRTDESVASDRDDRASRQASAHSLELVKGKQIH